MISRFASNSKNVFALGIPPPPYSPATVVLRTLIKSSSLVFGRIALAPVIRTRSPSLRRSIHILGEATN